MVDAVSEVTRLNWHEVLEMSVIEFLNINCYLRDKNNYEKEQMEKWKARH